MRATTVLLSVIFLLILFCGCRKNDEKPALLKGLRGKVIVSSCVTTAVQVLNKDIGSSWTDCRDQQTYPNMIDVVITNPQGRLDGEEFTFEIVEKEPYPRCMAAEYCGRAPAESYHIAIVQD